MWVRQDRNWIFNSSPSGDLNEIEGLPRESGRLPWLAGCGLTTAFLSKIDQVTRVELS
jgi:hypothetical protein